MKRQRLRALVPPDLALAIRGLHPRLKRQVRASVAHILVDPRIGKALTLDLAGCWSFRIGRYRLVYRIGAERLVELISFGPRETIYEETSRLIAKQSGPKSRLWSRAT